MIHLMDWQHERILLIFYTWKVIETISQVFSSMFRMYPFRNTLSLLPKISILFFLSLLHLQEHKYTYRIPGERGGSCTQELMELETSTQQLKLVYKFHIFSSYFPHNYRLPWILSEGSHLLSMQRAIIFQVKGVS